MTQELEALLEKIKEDGVDKARAEGDKIVKEARAKAETIVEDARSKAEKIVSEAEEEAGLLVRKGEESLRQSGRNIMLSMRQQLQERMVAVVRACLRADTDAKAFAQAIANAVAQQLKGKEGGDLEVLVSRQDGKAMREHLLAALGKDLKKEPAITPTEHIESGFQLRFEKDDVLYDFSDRALAETLADFLSPRLNEILAKSSEQKTGDKKQKTEESQAQEDKKKKRK